MSDIVALICARGGSKGIPRKNVKLFCGKPLVGWSIEQAVKSKSIVRTYVSTDNEEIASVSKDFGAIIIDRPAELSTDATTMEPVIKHAVEQLGSAEAVVHLQCTSPVRSSDDIDAAVEEFRNSSTDCVFSAALQEDICLWREEEGGLESFTYDYKNRGRRQDRKPFYLENGSIYVFRPENMEKFGNRLGGKIGVSLMPLWKSFEIDDEESMATCEFFMLKMLREQNGTTSLA